MTRPAWERPFLYHLLAQRGVVRRAADLAGVDTARLYRFRKDDSLFAGRWDSVMALVRDRDAEAARRDALRRASRDQVEALDSKLAAS